MPKGEMYILIQMCVYPKGIFAEVIFKNILNNLRTKYNYNKCVAKSKSNKHITFSLQQQLDE